MQIFLHRYCLLAAKFGVDLLRTAFDELGIADRPSFWPLPEEVAGVCMAMKKREEAAKRVPIGHCRECDDMRVVCVEKADGGREARTCGCVIRWRRGNNVIANSGKDRSAGQ